MPLLARGTCQRFRKRSIGILYDYQCHHTRLLKTCLGTRVHPLFPVMARLQQICDIKSAGIFDEFVMSGHPEVCGVYIRDLKVVCYIAISLVVTQKSGLPNWTPTSRSTRRCSVQQTSPYCGLGRASVFSPPLLEWIYVCQMARSGDHATPGINDGPEGDRKGARLRYLFKSCSKKAQALLTKQRCYREAAPRFDSDL